MTANQLDAVQPEGWARGPGYSHATITAHGRLLHVSAIAGLEPGSFEFVAGDGLLAQWRRVLENLRTLVEAAGTTMQRVAHVRMYVVDMDDYRANAPEIGRLHRQFFGTHRPAATLVGVASMGAAAALIEIEAVVELGPDG
jgi:enamine deaminase RidA (YjgF/YER057c/UK114 family)